MTTDVPPGPWESIDALVDRINAKIATCHERVECPRCHAPVGKRCRRLPRGYRADDLDDPALRCKHPHEARWTQEVPKR